MTICNNLISKTCPRITNPFKFQNESIKTSPGSIQESSKTSKKDLLPIWKTAVKAVACAGCALLAAAGVAAYLASQTKCPPLPECPPLSRLPSSERPSLLGVMDQYLANHETGRAVKLFTRIDECEIEFKDGFSTLLTHLDGTEPAEIKKELIDHLNDLSSRNPDLQPFLSMLQGRFQELNDSDSASKICDHKQLKELGEEKFKAEDWPGLLPVLLKMSECSKNRDEITHLIHSYINGKIMLSNSNGSKILRDFDDLAIFISRLFMELSNPYFRFLNQWDAEQKKTVEYNKSLNATRMGG